MILKFEIISITLTRSFEIQMILIYLKFIKLCEK